MPTPYPGKFTEDARRAPPVHPVSYKISHNLTHLPLPSNDSNNNNNIRSPYLQEPLDILTGINLNDIFGKPIASGKYGTVYAVKMTRDIRQKLKDLLRQDPKAYIRIPSRVSTVAVKIQTTAPVEVSNLYAHLDDLHKWRKEAKAHLELSHLACVPTLYAAGFLSSTVFMTVMHMIEGSVTMTQTVLTQKMYRQAQNCISDIWRAGWSHADAHPGNLLVTNKGKVYVIDFGESVQLPSTIRQQIKNAYKQRTDPITIYNTIIQPYVNSYKRAVGFKWYNPDGKAMKVYRALAQRELEARKVGNYL